MNKKFWNLYAPIYKRVMKLESEPYRKMYEDVAKVAQGKDVLEIATGPGALAKYVAPHANKMTATDYSEGMIQTAKKGEYSSNLTFEVADATALMYDEDSFDVVVIANVLHIVSEPENVLNQIDRVLKKGGVLIAPNYVEHKKGFVSRTWEAIIKAAGIKFENQWSAEEYKNFLEENGWEVYKSYEIPVRIPLLYTECVRKC